MSISSGGGGFGFLSGLRNLVGSKALTRKDIEPALAKMKDHLIGKLEIIYTHVLMNVPPISLTTQGNQAPNKEEFRWFKFFTSFLTSMWF